MSREHEVRLPDHFWQHSTEISTDAKALYSILLTFIYRADFRLTENTSIEPID